jgi:hypothetical protein
MSYGKSISKYRKLLFCYLVSLASLFMAKFYSMQSTYAWRKKWPGAAGKAVPLPPCMVVSTAS